MRDSNSYSRKQITDIYQDIGKTYQNNRTHFRFIETISGE